MNVVFNLKNEELNQLFIEVSASEGLANIKGHRIVGECVLRSITQSASKPQKLWPIT